MHYDFHLGYSLDLSWIIGFVKASCQVFRTFGKLYGEVHMVKKRDLTFSHVNKHFWKQIQPQSSLQMTTVPTNILIVVSSETLSQNHSAKLLLDF